MNYELFIKQKNLPYNAAHTAAYGRFLNYTIILLYYCSGENTSSHLLLIVPIIEAAA